MKKSRTEKMLADISIQLDTVIRNTTPTVRAERPKIYPGDPNGEQRHAEEMRLWRDRQREMHPAIEISVFGEVFEARWSTDRQIYFIARAKGSRS